MGLLVIVILAIIMMSFVTFSGISYLRLEPYTIMRYEKEVEGGFLQLVTGYYAYKSMYGINLSGTDWNTKLDNINIKIPNNIETSTWSYSNVSGKQYFCLTGTLNNNIYNASVNYANRSTDNVYINNACGATTSTTTLTRPTSSTVTFSITYWITK